MGLKTLSQQFRDDLLQLNLKTPPDIVLGIVNLESSSVLSGYEDALGKDAVIHTDRASVSVKNPGDVATDAIQYRKDNFARNLQSEPNLIKGLEDLTQNQITTLNFFAQIGTEGEVRDLNIVHTEDITSDAIAARKKNLDRNLLTTFPPFIFQDRGTDVVINDFKVTEESIDDTASNIRTSLFKRNKPTNKQDPSESDLFVNGAGYTYTTLLDSIGTNTIINDYLVPNAVSVSTQSNISPLVSYFLASQLNRYMPTEVNTFETKIETLKDNQSQTPYIDASSKILNTIQPEEYVPSEFLDINLGTSPFQVLTNYYTDPFAYLKFGGKPLQNETLLMNIAALELKYNFQTRIDRALERDTLGATGIDEALSNPLALINLLKDPANNLFEKHYEITVPDNPIGKAAQFVANLTGSGNLITSLIPDDREDFSPSCFLNNKGQVEPKQKSGLTKFIDDLSNKSDRADRDLNRLDHTGSGQKFQLFSNIYHNRYAPDYSPIYESGVFKAIDKALSNIAGVTGFLGFSAGKRPQSRYYIGAKGINSDPYWFLQDSQGDMVNSPENITTQLKINYSKTEESDKDFFEPGYDEVSKYYSLSTDFIWHDQHVEKFQSNGKDIPTLSSITDDLNRKYSRNWGDNGDANERFRECSILYKTEKLLEKSITDNAINLAIDQTKTKFFDGYSLYPKGSGVMSVDVFPIQNNQQETIGFRYEVPGLDIQMDLKSQRLAPVGKRNPSEMSAKTEFCRTWTKIRPYSKVTDLIRYKELIRNERNSVIDRYANYNIYPTALNVNTGYGRLGDGLGDAVVEAFGEKRARKYMFSIENLAWRDAKLFTDLPPCEKGFNGGRIMWFPPYDIKFTDNSSAAWTSHQFLGRPEPIYTYNYTERTGTLSWKIIVDHPSILNLLAQKELANMPDTAIDEILSAFWAGCIEFDIFELARIWGVFSESDISYFEKVIADLDLKTPNGFIKNKIEDSGTKQPTSQVEKININGIVPEFLYNDIPLFFENDVPLPPSLETIVKPYDEYFQTYIILANGNAQGTAVNAETIKGKDDANLVRYDQTIGINSFDNYFFKTNGDGKQYGFLDNYNKVITDLGSDKFIGYNLEISVNAYASPLNEAIPDYNTQLAERRWESVTKWLILSILKNCEGENGELLTVDNIDDFFINVAGDTVTEVNVKRKSNKENKKDTITIKLVEAEGVSINTALAETHINKLPTLKLNGNSYEYFNINKSQLASDPVGDIYYAFLTGAEKATILASTNDSSVTFDDGTNIEKSFIGAFSPTKGVPRTPADLVCSVMSIESSYARRVNITVGVAENVDDSKDKTKPDVVENTPPMEAPQNSTNVTKREIAQKILNKLLTECDYFELLDKEAPFVFQTIKSKLKYFSPAFHSMTPEGLNARLTFLQQCVRPGETLKSSTNNGCDASNTAFGKPPVCVLRIGDFYNTKIVINDINLSYDPLVWDLNPEGIGAQPMLVDVNMSFKYIGGSGLRKHVDRLQNALSFNYYANTDIYDDRTFANTDQKERNLINLETSFFDGGTLDLIPIVDKAKQITYEEQFPSIPNGLLGKVSSPQNRLAGGNYYLAVQTVNQTGNNTYKSNLVYLPQEYVLYNGNYYVRQYDDKGSQNPALNKAGVLPTDTSGWDAVSNRNYGEYAFRSEYGRVFFETVDVNYKSLYQKIYKNYLDILDQHIKVKSFDDTNNKKFNFLTFNIIGKPYTENVDLRKDLSTVNLHPSDITSGFTSGITINSIITQEADVKGYKKFQDFFGSGLGSDNFTPFATDPIKLHLYPQNLFYEIPSFNRGTNITSMGYPTNDESLKIDPGNFTDGYYNGNINAIKNSEATNLYIKKNPLDINVITSIYSYFKTDLINKLSNDLVKFWQFPYENPNGVNSLYSKYLSNFDLIHKDILRNYFIDQLNTFYDDKINQLTNTNVSIDKNIDTLATYYNGISVVLSGYDGIIAENSKNTELYQVIPNEKKLSSQPEKLFGYDPYSQYLNIHFNSSTKFSLVNFSDIKSIVDNKNNSGTDFNKFLRLGNGQYFFRQITTDSDLLNYYGGTTTFTNAAGAKSLELNGVSITGDTQNYIFQNVTFDPQTNIIVNNSMWMESIAELNNTIGSTPAVNRYKMSYVFEKLGYEFFEFSNKTLGVILNDRDNTSLYEIDIERSEENELMKSLIADLGSLDDIIKRDLISILLNGRINNNFPLTFEYFNLISGTTSDVYTQTKNNLVNKVDYKITITQDLIDDAVNYISGSTISPSGQTAQISALNGILNKTYRLSAMSEVFYIEFFNNLIENKDVHILAIQDALSAVKPKKNISKLSGIFKNNAQDKKTNNINNLIPFVFNRILAFVNEFKTPISSMADIYQNSVISPFSSYVNDVFYNQFSPLDTTSINPGDTNSAAERLLKGDDSEYTLTLRKTSKISTNYQNTLNLFDATIPILDSTYFT